MEIKKGLVSLVSSVILLGAVSLGTTSCVYPDGPYNPSRPVYIPNRPYAPPHRGPAPRHIPQRPYGPPHHRNR